jgi:hypothetical protein
MNNRVLLSSFFLACLWLYVVLFLAYPSLSTQIFHFKSFVASLQEIKIKEVSAGIMEKRGFIVAFLTAIDFIIVAIIEESKTKTQTLTVFGVFLLVLFMQTFSETISKIWPYLFISILILVIKLNTIMTIAKPSTIELTHL